MSNLEHGSQRVYLDQVYEAARFLDVDISALLPPSAEVFPAPDVNQSDDDPLTARGKILALQITDELLKQRPKSQRGSKKGRS